MTQRPVVLDMLKRAAAAGEACPTNGEIATAIDARSAATAVRVLNELEREGLIAVERGNTQRVVTIRATGQRTAGVILTPHWRLGGGEKADKAAAATRETLEKVRDVDLPRVHRDPCFYCGARGDVACQHRAAA